MLNENFNMESSKVTEEAVLIYIKLSDSEFGTWDDREKCYAFEDALIEEFSKQDIGEIDGHEFGEGYCVLYIYGNSADHIYNSISPILSEANLSPGSYVIIRFGGPGALEKRVKL